MANLIRSTSWIIFICCNLDTSLNHISQHSCVRESFYCTTTICTHLSMNPLWLVDLSLTSCVSRQKSTSHNPPWLFRVLEFVFVGEWVCRVYLISFIPWLTIRSFAQSIFVLRSHSSIFAITAILYIPPNIFSTLYHSFAPIRHRLPHIVEHCTLRLLHVIYSRNPLHLCTVFNWPFIMVQSRKL